MIANQKGQKGMSQEHESVETQVALLKQELENQRRSLSDLTKSQNAQTEVIHNMDKKIDQVLLIQSGLPARILDLEMQEAQRKGALVALGAVATAAGAAAGWIASLFSNRHP